MRLKSKASQTHNKIIKVMSDGQIDELIPCESGRVRWTDGRNDGVWKRNSVMANCYDGWGQMDRLENISTTSARDTSQILSSWSLDQNAQADKVSAWKNGGIQLNEWQTKFNWSPMETDGRMAYS